ncbi:hypothetical protein RUM44_012103 [Polyplax serrata]|uniref:Uncharacterized protein n=1 Tax=Polyplax serrata TaxID=468196 RepID=A0ABR1BE90_POLSC
MLGNRTLRDFQERGDLPKETAELPKTKRPNQKGCEKATATEKSRLLENGWTCGKKMFNSNSHDILSNPRS